MKDFLDEYVTSLSSKQRTQIYDVLSAARVGKEELDSLAKKLANTKKLSPIAVKPEAFGGLISASGIDAIYREVSRKLLDLFQVSNNISLLLDSHTSLLTSEIKALDNELVAIEKAIDNYAFTLSDNGFYNYAFTETFNDDIMMDDSGNIRLTDRSGVDFYTSEYAAVNSASGNLTLSPSLQVNYHVNGMVVDSNCAALITSDTGVQNSANQSVGNGWRIAVSSPRPITSSITDSTKSGAQFAVEYTLDSANPCDTVIITPFSDIPIEVENIKLYSSLQDSNPITIVNTTTVIDKPTHFSFQLQNIAKVKIVLNQPIYNRGAQTPSKEQIIYRDFVNSVRLERDKVAEYTHKEYKRNDKVWKRVFLSSQKNDKDVNIFKAEIPQVNFEALTGPLTLDKLLDRDASFRSSPDIWNYQSKMTTFFRKMMDEKVFPNNMELLNDRHIYNVGSTNIRNYSAINAMYVSGINQQYPRIANIQSPINVDIAAYPIINEQDYLQYQYNIGIRNFQVGTGVRLYRGVYITKQIPAPSDSSEVKLKADEINYSILDTSRDATEITSIEYSISNKSRPGAEEDWISILPIDADSILGERVFINEAGYGILRFAADAVKEFSLFKNGYLISASLIKQIKSVDGASFKQIQIPMDSFSSLDIFTANYFTYENEHIINFAKKGFDQSLLASAYDANGPGETFSNTNNGQIIGLTYDPYVSYDLINAGSNYSTIYGLQGYQPITIVLADGTVALNQTNYVGIQQNNLADFNSDTIAYIHSGKNIIFNKPIDSSFTVYYQYLPSNLRLRIILRVNDLNYVTPVVNSVQVKTKTLKADPRKTF